MDFRGHPEILPESQIFPTFVKECLSSKRPSGLEKKTKSLIPAHPFCSPFVRRVSLPFCSRCSYAGSLCLTQRFSDLQVELHEASAGLGEVPAGAHHSQAARLAQRLVAEVDVQQCLHGVLALAAEDVVRPQRPAQDTGMPDFREACLHCNTTLCHNIRGSKEHYRKMCSVIDEEAEIDVLFVCVVA